MKKLIQLFEVIIFVILCFTGIGYCMNYRTSGELSFVDKSVIVYANSDLTSPAYTLEPGETFISLTNFSNDSIKIRYDNSKTQKQEIGFIHFSDCQTYVFPLDNPESINSPIVIAIESNISFEDFLNIFVDAMDEYGVVGVYIEEVSEYSENNLSSFSSFCESMKIPYGTISAFDDITVGRYIDEKSALQDDTFSSYEILPHVFKINDVLDGYSFDEELSECIFQTESMREDNIRRYWLTSKSIDSDKKSDNTLLVSDSENFGYTYVSSSAKFNTEVSEAYNSILSN